MHASYSILWLLFWKLVVFWLLPVVVVCCVVSPPAPPAPPRFIWSLSESLILNIFFFSFALGCLKSDVWRLFLKWCKFHFFSYTIINSGKSWSLLLLLKTCFLQGLVLWESSAGENIFHSCKSKCQQPHRCEQKGHLWKKVIYCYSKFWAVTFSDSIPALFPSLKK